jgi:hypothetical protein
MKSVVQTLQVVFLSLSLASASAQAPSTDSPIPKPTPPAGLRVAGTNEPIGAAGTHLTNRPARNRLPFQGSIKSVDATAMTVTLAGPKDQDRLLRMDGESRLIKTGKPAPLAEIVPGDYARGLLKRNDRGEEVVVHSTFGPKPTPKPKSAPRPKSASSTGTTPATETSPRPAPASTTPK